MQGWGIVLAALFYLLFLFVVASFGDRRKSDARRFKGRPAIYALSLAIYCTSWTFFGSVGLATTTGLDFLAIYLGPVIMITLGAPLYSHIVAIAKSERITSIADFIASRYGKSTGVGALATIIAVLGTVPYIALQLKAISSSVEIMVTQYQPSVLETPGVPIDTSFIIALLLAAFAILFGTRHADATEHQDGLMLAVATESIVKLIAFLTIGLFVTFWIFDGAGDMLAKAQASEYVTTNFYAGIHPTRFAVFTLLSACAFVLLPRQFHVGVVENHSQADLKSARWMFPLYLVLINLFVIPVALGGMLSLGTSVDADTYVLALPLAQDATTISLIVFIGGLSAATAMVIVACVALAIMISNNLLLPAMLKRSRTSEAGDMAMTLLNIRRAAIFVIITLAFAYFKVAGDSAALASIGLLSFAAVAQFAPSFFGGLIWRRGTARGASWGMCVGFAMWSYTLFLPTLLDPNSQLLLSGPLGIDWLRPQALFGVEAAALDHGVFFSLFANTLAYVVASMSRLPRSIERMQANAFWIRGKRAADRPERLGRAITVAELRATVSNYLGHQRCDRALDRFYRDKGARYDTRELADEDVIHFSEQLLASAIGAASSRLVLSLLLQKHEDAGESTIQLLDDASEALQYNRDLLQTALDQVDQGISVFDRDFRLSSWNRQFRALLNLPAELGQAGIPLARLAEAIAVNSNEEFRSPSDLVKLLLDTDHPFYLTLKNSGRIIEIQTRPVPDGGHVISWNDMTEKEKAAQALQEANETLERRVRERTEELTRLNIDLARARENADAANIGKTRFIAAVGHDILQPLNAARLYASSLSEQLAKSPKQVLANNVDDALESVEDILQSVLAISRLDAGGLTPHFTVFSAQRLMKKLEVEFRPIAAAKGLDFKVVQNSFHIKSDYSLLRRLLQNLVSNAIKYTKSGQVTLDARVVRNQLVFEIVDTGAGIQDEDREAIFDEFRRLEEGKQLAQGLGLGLSIVKRLSQTLNHDVSFSSQLGKGSKFLVSVPLGAAPAATVAQIKSGNAGHSNFNGMLVYCIDNEKRILDGMRILLEGWGCEVVTFADSAPLLAQIKTSVPSFIIADYHLENETGLEVISSARAALGTEVPSVLITADRSAAVRNAARAINVNLLNKPLRPAALRALMESIGKAANVNEQNIPNDAAE